MIILLILALRPVFALTNFDGCARELVVDADHVVPLGPGQIAVRGPLGDFTDLGHDADRKTWIVTDRFVHEEIAPRLDTEVFWLKPGRDYVYLLGPDGRVFAHGHYAEFEKGGKIWMPGRGKTKALNRPRLLVDRTRDQRSFADYKVLEAFARGAEAVVIQTPTPSERRRLASELGPWLRRYEERAVTSGRLRFGDVVVEPKAFERVVLGEVRLEWRHDALRRPYLAVAIVDGDEVLDLADDRRLIPLDASHRALGEFRVGEAPAHEAVLRAAARVVTLVPVF